MVCQNVDVKLSQYANIQNYTCFRIVKRKFFFRCSRSPLALLPLSFDDEMQHSFDFDEMFIRAAALRFRSQIICIAATECRRNNEIFEKTACFGALKHIQIPQAINTIPHLHDVHTRARARARTHLITCVSQHS